MTEDQKQIKRERSRLWRLQNKERSLANSLAWARANPDKKAIQSKRYRDKVRLDKPDRVTISDKKEYILYHAAKMRCKKSGLPFDIELSDIVIPDVCPVLGIPLTIKERDSDKRRLPSAPSIDRIDNSRGYVKGNVRVISWRANRLKGDATLQELEALVSYLKHDEALGHTQ